MIRRACVLAGILVLFLQGSSGGHLLLVEHGRCAEHGELVHNGEAHDHVASEHGHTDSVAVHGMPDAGADEAHEHCSASADRRDALVSLVEAQLSARVNEAPQGSTRPNAFIVADTARFRVAPKNSPPA